jgi:hypothetical protein
MKEAIANIIKSESKPHLPVCWSNSKAMVELQQAHLEYEMNIKPCFMIELSTTEEGRPLLPKECRYTNPEDNSKEDITEDINIIVQSHSGHNY